MHYRYEKEILSKINIAEELKEVKDLLAEEDIPLVYCHNDLLCKNIIYNESEGTHSILCYLKLLEKM